MRRATTTLLLLAAGGTTILGLADAASGQQLDREGYVTPFAAGNEFAWRIPGDQFLLYMVAPKTGADIDLTWAGVGYPVGQRHILHIAPNEVDGAHFSYADGGVRRVTILNGTGFLSVVRNELMSGLPIGEAAPHKYVETSLAPGECRNYNYSTAYMTQHALLRGEGEGVTFTIFASNLAFESTAEDEIGATLDPTRVSAAFIQACNTSATTRTALVEGIYPAPEGTVTTGDRSTPGVGVIGAFILVAVACLRRRTFT